MTRVHEIEAVQRGRKIDAVPRLDASFEGEPVSAVRAKIVRTVGAMDGARHQKLIQKGLADAEPEVRSAAVEALSTLKTPNADADLISALAGETNPGVRQQIVFWLGQRRVSKATAALAAVLANDPDSNVRLQAAWSLRWIGGIAARVALKNSAAKDSDARVRTVAHE